MQKFYGALTRAIRLLIAPAIVFTCGAANVADAADAGDIAEGMRLYMQKGNCQACHGWSGDGRKTDNQMPDGANLRETKLDRATFVMIVKCGLPGTGMPPFDRLAYSDGRCFGKKESDLRAQGIRMADPPATLQPSEVDLLADFAYAKIVGKGAMDRAMCADYWGGASEVC
ncbi:MAG TPA: cytochrome c, partial [Burkholderiales bacterium]|nr:cytochrome c [Burkholderiales bacterium]